MTRSSDGSIKENMDLFKDAIDVWGVDEQVDLAVEELAELTVALQHYQRGRVGRMDVAGELADVRIMFEQLRLFFGQEMVDRAVDEKIGSLEKRVENELYRQEK